MPEYKMTALPLNHAARPKQRLHAEALSARSSQIPALDLAGLHGEDACVVVPRHAAYSPLTLEPAKSVNIERSSKGQVSQVTVWCSGSSSPTHPVYVDHGRRLVQELPSTVFMARVTGGPVDGLMVAKAHALKRAEALRVAEAALLPLPWCDEPEMPCQSLRDAVFGHVAQSPARAHRVMVSATHLITLHPLACGDLFDLAVPLALLSPQKAAPLYEEIAGQLLHQVSTMHARDVVHSDIKLENMLFWQDGTIAINDFGAAFGLWERQDLASNALSYTLEYASAEVLARADVWPDKNASPFPHDLFALGTSLAVLIAHRRLFCRETSNQLPYARYAEALHQRRIWQRNYPAILARQAGGHPSPANASKEVCPTLAHFFSVADALRHKTPRLAPMILQLLHPEPKLRGNAQSHLAALSQDGPMSPAGDSALATWLATASLAQGPAWQPLALRTLPLQKRPATMLRRSSISGAMVHQQRTAKADPVLAQKRRGKVQHMHRIREELVLACVLDQKAAQ